MEFKLVTFPQSGYLEAKLKREDLYILLDEIEEIKVSLPNFNGPNEFIGNIVTEYDLIKSRDSIEKLLAPYIFHYLESFSTHKLYLVNKTTSSLVLEKLWVNFQSKHEFVFVHQHSGLLSFVIWVDIPYIMSEEHGNACQNKSCSGAFEFLFAHALRSVNSYRIEADKSYNLHMILFPSALAHTVYPFFSSNEYRVSVAGNFCYDN
jgi:hypothetical protein